MNIGEIISLQGQSPRAGGIENVQRGFNFGQQLQKPLMEQQKEDAATAEKFAKMTSIDQSVYSAPRRELAKQAVDEIMGEVWFKYNELEKQKKGAGANYLRQPETQSKIYGLQQKLKTYQDQTQRDKAFLEGVQKGQYQADPELVRILSQGTADELRNYQSRFGGVRENLDLDYATYKPISVEDEVKAYAGTQGLFTDLARTKGGYNYFKIPKNQVQQFGMDMAAKQGGIEQAYFTNRDLFEKIYGTMAADAQKKGLPIDERALMLSTAAEVYNQTYGKRLAGLEIPKPVVRPRTGGAGSANQNKIDIPTDYYNRLTTVVEDVAQNPQSYPTVDSAVEAIAQATDGKMVKVKGGGYRVQLPSTLVQGKAIPFDLQTVSVRDPKANRMYRGHGLMGSVTGTAVGSPEIAWYDSKGKEVSPDSPNATAYFRLNVKPEISEETINGIPANTWKKMGVKIGSNGLPDIEEATAKMKEILSPQGTFVVTYPVGSEDARSFMSQNVYQGATRVGQFNLARKNTAGGKTSVSSQTNKKEVPLSTIKSLVGKKGYEGYTEKELVDYYSSQGYIIK